MVSRELVTFCSSGLVTVVSPTQWTRELLCGKLIRAHSLPEDHILSEDSRINLAHGQSSECLLLSTTRECKAASEPPSDGYGTDGVHQINSYIPTPMSVFICSDEEAPCGPAAATELLRGKVDGSPLSSAIIRAVSAGKILMIQILVH